MPQAYKICNLDLGEVLHPHAFGHGYRLMDFADKGEGIMLALALLLADGNGRSGGDFDCPDPDPENVIGRWAGHRIVVAGDCADLERYVPLGYVSNLYKYAEEHMTDISELVINRINKQEAIAGRKAPSGEKENPPT